MSGSQGKEPPRLLKYSETLDVSTGESMMPVDNSPLDRDLRTGVCYASTLPDSGENTTIVLDIDFFLLPDIARSDFLTSIGLCRNIFESA